MVPDSFDNLPLFIINTFTGLGDTDIAVPEIGDGADEKGGLPIGSVKNDEFIGGIAGRASHDMDIEIFQEFPWCIEKRRRIVITCRDDDVAVRGGRYTAEKAIVQGLGAVTGRAVVKDIACHEEDVDALFLYEIRQPV
jgi:hypothetical protein